MDGWSQPQWPPDCYPPELGEGLPSDSEKQQKVRVRGGFFKEYLSNIKIIATASPKAPEMAGCTLIN